MIFDRAVTLGSSPAQAAAARHLPHGVRLAGTAVHAPQVKRIYAQERRRQRSAETRLNAYASMAVLPIEA